MNKFWNWNQDASGGRVLRLEGPIDKETFWGDEVTPQAFRDELESGTGDISVYINSPGGNVFAAAEIYTMLREYKGHVTVKIPSVAASAATVVAMAGDTVLMSPTAMMFLHDPSTVAAGNASDMQKAINALNAVKESIICAYQEKSGLSHNRLSQLMSAEGWLTAKDCVDLGFADSILPRAYNPFDGEEPEEEQAHEDTAKDVQRAEETKDHLNDRFYSARQMDLTILNSLGVKCQEQPKPIQKPVPKPEAEDKPPVIGMDGKTADGSVPFNLLMREMECMR